MTEPRTGARILVDQLRIHGTDCVFGVPGESYLAVLNALHDTPEIRMIVCRQEGGAANMAEAYGKLTGRPGICFVTRGPGATHAAIGCHTGLQDSTPMILFIGQVRRGFRDREAFQEVDYRAMFAPLAKWVVEIESADRVPELIARAFRTATSGRPGPVVVSLPEDMLTDLTDAEDVARYVSAQASPSESDIDQLAEILKAAQRPLAIVGGSTWSADARAGIEAFVRANGIPICASLRCQDYVDNDHPLYAGHIGIGIDPGLARRVREADTILALGPRLGEATTRGYSLLSAPVPNQTLIHVHPDPNELGRVYQPRLGIASGMPQIAVALSELSLGRSGAWLRWAEAARRDYLASLDSAPSERGVDLAEAMRVLRSLLDDDAIVTNGAGNYTAWVHRFFRYRTFRSQLAPTSGAMGYGVPAAVAAAAVHPDRQVVSISGDGCFMMNGQELATAVQYDLAPLFIVVNNGMYGTIRMHQEAHYPGRVYGTSLRNPDFARLAVAYGAYGETVERTEDLAPAFERALNSKRAALVELRTDPEAISPRATISSLRERAEVGAG